MGIRHQYLLNLIQDKFSLIDNKDSKKRYRADVLIEDYAEKLNVKAQKEIALSPNTKIIIMGNSKGAPVIIGNN